MLRACFGLNSQNCRKLQQSSRIYFHQCPRRWNWLRVCLIATLKTFSRLRKNNQNGLCNLPISPNINGNCLTLQCRFSKLVSWPTYRRLFRAGQWSHLRHFQKKLGNWLPNLHQSEQNHCSSLLVLHCIFEIRWCTQCPPLRVPSQSCSFSSCQFYALFLCTNCSSRKSIPRKHFC